MVKVALLSLLIAWPLLAKTIDTCFSPTGHCDQVMVSWIDSAKRSLDGAIYNLTDPHISAALVRAHQRGVKVRIVQDQQSSLSQNARANELTAAGIPVKTQKGSGGGLQHHKFLVIDSKYVITGSFNWTRSAVRRNDENFVILDDVVPRFHQEFERLWQLHD